MRTLHWWGKHNIPRLAKVHFQMRGGVTQTIEILDPGTTLEDIETGLRYGQYYTTEMHENITEAGTRRVVARIIGQNGSTSYFDFRVVELAEKKANK